jgi:hypothetical protein
LIAPDERSLQLSSGRGFAVLQMVLEL